MPCWSVGWIKSVEMSIWRYIWRESVEMISPSICFAMSKARAVFPEAVGPRTTTRGFGWVWRWDLIFSIMNGS